MSQVSRRMRRENIDQEGTRQLSGTELCVNPTPIRSKNARADFQSLKSKDNGFLQ